MRTFLVKTQVTVLLLLLISCKGQREPEYRSPAGSLSESQSGSRLVARQIVYDVIVKNPDPQDEWTEKCLEGLHREELVDFIFSGLYDQRFKAFDIFNDEPIPVRDIRKMEKDRVFTRDQVSKIQFVEDWYLDPHNYTMTKKVTEIRLGVEHFDGFGMHLGHNPLFKVRLTP